MKKIFALLIFSLPYLSAQQDDSWKIYDDTDVARIDITISPSTLQWIYDNPHSDSEHYAQFHFFNQWINESADSIGFRLRGNTSRDSKKKSFKISFNSFIKGRKFYGVEKLNLNGEHNDPSIIRSKLCFDLYRDIGVTASRAHHVRVYINGAYYGLYISVEHIDEEFLKKNFADDNGNLWKCLYPADLEYLGTDPALYKTVMHSDVEPAYEFKTNEELGDYSRFAKLVDVINNTSAAAFADSAEKYLDVRRVLQYFAMNTLLGSWDDYRFLMNNYYLYHIPSEDKFTLIPYDYDNTFGIDWFSTDWSNADPYQFPTNGQGVRPLSNNILANDQYRDLFTHFIEFYRTFVYDLPLWEQRINRLKDSITTAVTEDTYRTLDYNFTMDDFHNSFSSSSYQNKHVKFGLKQFINARNASLPAQLQYKDAPPIAYHVAFSPRFPSSSDSITVTTSCFSHTGLKDVSIHFQFDGMLSEQIFTMKYSPAAQTKSVEEADRWIGTIPPLGAGKLGTFKIYVTDSLDRTQSYPRAGAYTIKTPSLSSPSIIINEFMADNGSIADSAGEFDDWVELFNPTDSSITLTNKYLTDKNGYFTKWKFTEPNLVLNPGTYAVVWCDEDSGQQGIHANFKLSAGGEFLALTDSDGVTLLDSITFGAQQKNVSFGRFPNGADTWGFMSPSPWLANNPITTVQKMNIVPDQFFLSQNYPNPFNPTTIIGYHLPVNSYVLLKVFDVLGRKVTTLVNENKRAGYYEVRWNAAEFASGVYFYQLRAEKFVQTKKLLLHK